MKKSFTARVLALLLCVATLATVTPLFATAVESLTEEAPLTALSATITEPVAGEKPDYTVTPGDSRYTTLLQTWYLYEGTNFSPLAEDTAVFEAGKSYWAVVWFEPTEGTQLSDEATATINGRNAEVWSYILGGARAYFLEFIAQEAPLAELSATITEPVAGEKPDFTATANDSKYTALVKNWYEVVSDTDLSPLVDSNAVFEAGKEYMAVVWFEPAEGTRFSDEATATVNGANGELWSYIYGGARSYYVVFSLPEAPAEPTGTEAEPTATDVEPTGTDVEPTATDVEPTGTAIEPTETGVARLLGDANADGTVTMEDVLVMRKFLAGIEVSMDAVAADVNGDGVVNMKDVLIIRKYLAKIVTKLG